MQKIKELALSIGKLKWMSKALLLFISIFFILLVSIAISPLQKLQEIENLVRSDSLFLKEYDSICNHPEMSMFVREKTYKEALLKLAEFDSIQMVINLSDSTVNLFIRGVMIHQTKIKSFEKPKMFKELTPMQEVKLFSQALPVQEQYASIVKEPIVVRHAPKDTLEAALNAWQPDTMIQNPAFLALSLEHGIHIILEQEENPRFYDHWKKFNFYNRLRIRETMEALSDFVRIKKQEHHPVITIKMPVQDLRAIYRALPTQAHVVMKL